MSPGREGRPARHQAPAELLILDTTNLNAVARQIEASKRSRLRRDLHSLANQLDLTDPSPAALARSWALEVAL